MTITNELPTILGTTALLGLVCLGCRDSGSRREAPPIDLDYPEAPAVAQTDVYHDVEVEDPYRWLEDLDGAETAAWVAAQNEISDAYLEQLEDRGAIAARLETVWNYERFGIPWKEGDRYFFLRNDGLQDQSVLYVSDSLDAEPRVLLDPNGLSEDGTIALAAWSTSPDGSLIAYGVSDGGTDWKTWRVRDVDTGTDLDETIRDTKFTDVSWTPDSGAFYYSRYPVDENGEGDGAKAVKIYRHRIGEAQDADELVYEIPDEPRWQPYATVTEDGRYLIVTISEGYFANAVHYLPLRTPGATLHPVFDEWDALYEFVGNRSGELFFTTTLDAENSRLISVDVAAENPEIREVLGESENRLESVGLVGGHLVARYLQDARSAVTVFDLDGHETQTVDLPGIGTVSGFGGRATDSETFYTFSGFTSPGTVYHYDTDTGESTVFRQASIEAELDGYVTRQVFFESGDGTSIPMFITHRDGLELDGSNPTLLYGYGGFDVSLTPDFRPDRLVWLEMGGVLAIPNLRGGGEYGEKWHRAGTKLDKQNVFDDFIAAAEYLIDAGFTSTPRLAVQGGSNGGLLVGAVVNQRPDLFGAALPAVGVMDMLRYHLPSSNARAWSSDYGLSENSDEFRALYAYSPYHNLEPGECYPPSWITTADHDDRVVPWHTYKYGARLQAAQGCDNPILVRVETRAGHGAGKPTWMRIEEVSDAWAFLSRELGGLDVPGG